MPLATRARPLTDRYLAAVDQAVARPGAWVDVRVFDTRANAATTAACLRDGYLRVEPHRGDRAKTVAGRTCLATAGPVRTDVSRHPDGWLLRIRA